MLETWTSAGVFRNSVQERFARYFLPKQTVLDVKCMRLTTVVVNIPHPPFLVVFFFKLVSDDLFTLLFRFYYISVVSGISC